MIEVVLSPNMYLKNVSLFIIITYLTGNTLSSKNINTLLGLSSSDNSFLWRIVSGFWSLSKFCCIRFIQLSLLVSIDPISIASLMIKAALYVCFPNGLSDMLNIFFIHNAHTYICFFSLKFLLFFMSLVNMHFKYFFI